MRNLILLFGLLFSVVAYSQNESDQNPNYKAAYEQYVNVANDYVSKQGTTVQQTYVAIDPMEEKRIRKKIHKDHRAMRSLWKHEERMERAKNTRYYSTSYPVRTSFYGGISYPFYRSRFGIQFPIHGRRY
ncbi:hypothetical protein FHR24_000989 [Wenyingzhuangia heitensis]|uniref:Uncharacterized protein n=1 Tax=Wenyingzhuangia heitensis TaxID=1487859 RepID=A0ABX0U6R9_9FLAO|nr:hypothetical protein [Wenyingzhuangia heitensis]NIJ44550.1 hypothetical protein [Wenyingzhuangia heitensis]